MSSLKNLLHTIQTQQPVILNLTNIVTIDLVANCQLAVGAAPIMSMSQQESEELIQLCAVLYINLGTLNEAFVQQAQCAAALAKDIGKPIVLDPVGAGASISRTHAALSLAPLCSIIRGNASEILALATSASTSKGVEASHQTKQVINQANHLAHQTGSTIVVSGATDYVTNAKQHQLINGGSPLMTKVTGMGCAMAAIMAVFHAVEPDSFKSSVLACRFFAECGEKAAERSRAPGSFKMKLLDALYQPCATTQWE